MVLLTKFVSNAVLNPRAEKDGTTRGVLVGCVDRAGRAGRDVFVFLCVFLCIVAHFFCWPRMSNFKRAPEQSESHTNKFRFSNSSLAITSGYKFKTGWKVETGHTPRVSNTSPAGAPQPYGCSPFFFFLFGVLAPPLVRMCVRMNWVCGCIECADAFYSWLTVRMFESGRVLFN